jgi:hypothetical protein
MNDAKHRISETADKIVLKTQVKRGQGTRDQDKLDVKVKGSDPAETAARLNDVLTKLEERGVAGRLRSTQPASDSDSE